MELEPLIAKYGAEACIGCGRCTYSCVAAHRYEAFSPRRAVESIRSGKGLSADGLWACVACGACSRDCPGAVDFRGLVREARASWRTESVPTAAHHGVLGKVSALSARGRPDTARWVTDDLQLDEGSDLLLYVGCTPYFDVVFRHFRADLLEIPRSAVRVLNAMGIRPRVLPAERCCGHDAYWLGDDALFRAQAEANLEAVGESGVKEIVTVCPECLTAWRDLYPRVLGETGLRVRSMAEVMAEGIASRRLKLRSAGTSLTFQDPCRLSKHSGIIEQPRSVLGAVGELREMARSGASGACCGTAGWVNCDRTAKRVQMERLEEAAATGAEVLVTACPKCLVHLSCADAHHGDSLSRRIAIEDIHVLASRALSR
jgi:heterodisulfide reductase subunit D